MFEERYQTDLDRQLRLRKFTDAFDDIKKRHDIFKRHQTVSSIRALMRPDNKNYADKDDIMTVLLKALHTSNALYPLINIMFWTSLQRLYRRFCKSSQDPEELFGRIQWSFYQSVVEHNLKRLPRKIDVNIFLNTKKKVTAWLNEGAKGSKFESAPVDIQEAGIKPINLSESQAYPDEMEAYLLEMVYRRVITEIQYDVILETLVYKRMNQEEWSKKRGMSYNTARSLRYRAEQSIRLFEKKRAEEKDEDSTDLTASKWPQPGAPL